MTEFNEFQQIKRRFFAMRNGIIADALRRGGSPFKIIFGLNLPQIKDIAAELGVRPDLAKWLWENTSTRESMMLAPMLIDHAVITDDDASLMVMQSPSTEIIDSLCHSLLRHSPLAYQWGMKWATADTSLLRYAAMRLLWHHIAAHATEIRPVAEAEMLKNDNLTAGIARQLVEEIDFL
ncbi:MAG: DNA alkylation repair protein [Paramuribaculum sp.]|nr:DNA alkylation repair protein [Paramuribaculum sp.]